MSDEIDFEDLDIVQLLSGGPWMTIILMETKLCPETDKPIFVADCIWFDSHGKVHQRRFWTALLKKVDRPVSVYVTDDGPVPFKP